VKFELEKMVESGLLTQLQADVISTDQLVSFFTSELGLKIRECENVLREFKFSILDDSAKYSPDVNGEQVLLQGVVDCALIESDGITIIDFKTDHVTEATLSEKAEQYQHQICAYAQALCRIYELPIKEMYLYFFRVDHAVRVNL
jgi:ATP-dependent helicase/nuclease subunit A